MLLWYISMKNLHILEGNKNKLKESFDILRQERKSTFYKVSPTHQPVMHTWLLQQRATAGVKCFSSQLITVMLEDLSIKVLFRGLKLRQSLSRGSVSRFFFLDYFFHCNVATCILNLWSLQVLIVLRRKPTCFKIEFKAKLLASFFVSVKIRVLLWAPQ